MSAGSFKLTSPQILILESLSITPLSVAKLSTDTGLSASYLRSQIKLLEVTGRIERVDDRMPYIYRVPATSPFLQYRDKVSKYREILARDGDSDNSFVKLLRKAPKEHWPAIANDLRALVETIDMLESDGRLVDTLEGIL